MSNQDHSPIIGELLPCPFCGTKLRVFGKVGDDSQAAQHPTSDCVASLAMVSRADWAAWNTRSPDVVTDEMVEAGIAESNRQAVGCASPEGQCRAIYEAMREAALLKVALPS